MVEVHEDQDKEVLKKLGLMGEAAAPMGEAAHGQYVSEASHGRGLMGVAAYGQYVVEDQYHSNSSSDDKSFASATSTHAVDFRDGSTSSPASEGLPESKLVRCNGSMQEHTDSASASEVPESKLVRCYGSMQEKPVAWGALLAKQIRKDDEGEEHTSPAAPPASEVPKSKLVRCRSTSGSMQAPAHEAPGEQCGDQSPQTFQSLTFPSEGVLSRLIPPPHVPHSGQGDSEAGRVPMPKQRRIPRKKQPKHPAQAARLLAGVMKEKNHWSLHLPSIGTLWHGAHCVPCPRLASRGRCQPDCVHCHHATHFEGQEDCQSLDKEADGAEHAAKRAARAKGEDEEEEGREEDEDLWLSI